MRLAWLLITIATALLQPTSHQRFIVDKVSRFTSDEYRARFLPLFPGRPAALTLLSECIHCGANVIRLELIEVDGNQATVAVTVDGESFVERIKLDPYDQFDGNSSVGIDIFIRGNTDDNNLFVIINGNEAYKWSTRLKFPWAALHHINAVNNYGTVHVTKLSAEEKSASRTRIYFNLLREKGTLPNSDFCGITTNNLTVLAGHSTFVADAEPVNAELQCLNRDLDQPADKIVNGKNELAFLSPWMASLRYRKARTARGHVCGAVIIGKNWLLTAAHCITSIATYKVNFERDHCRARNRTAANFSHFEAQFKRELIIRVGDYVNNDYANEFDQFENQADYEIDAIIPHTSYCMFSTCRRQMCQMHKAFDIALIRTKTAIDFDRAVHPICLTPSATFARFAPGTCCTAVGWGINGDGVLSEILQKISIPIRQLKECAALPGWMESIQKTSRVKMQLDPNVEIGMLCAGGGDYDTCHGDSGGPLSCSLYHPVHGRQWFLKGLTSFGSPHCGSRVPGAYTNVSKYAFWIVKEIFEHEFPQ